MKKTENSNGVQDGWILRINEKVFFRRQERNRIHILQIEGQRFFVLNDVAAYLWLQLDGTLTVKELIQMTRKELGLESVKFPRLAKNFLNQLFLSNLVQRLDAREPSRSAKSQWIEKKSIDVKNLESLASLSSASLSSEPVAALGLSTFACAASAGG
jgi:hypothetical protein